MSLDNLACDVCGIRFADVVLYREHLASSGHEAGRPAHAPVDVGTQVQAAGMPTGSTVREDKPPSDGEIEGTDTTV